MNDFWTHLRVHIIEGLLAVIPLFLSYLAIRILYVLIDKRVMGFLEHFIHVRQIPGLGIVLLLFILYGVGVIVSNVAGRQLMRWIDHVGHRLPVLSAVYQIGKQLSLGISSQKGDGVFQKVRLYRITEKGIHVIAFVTGTVTNTVTGETLTRIFMPHVPNPATGFIFLVRDASLVDPGWSVEEAVKMIVSASIISPASLNATLSTPGDANGSAKDLGNPGGCQV